MNSLESSRALQSIQVLTPSPLIFLHRLVRKPKIPRDRSQVRAVVQRHFRDLHLPTRDHVLRKEELRKSLGQPSRQHRRRQRAAPFASVHGTPVSPSSSVLVCEHQPPARIPDVQAAIPRGQEGTLRLKRKGHECAAEGAYAKTELQAPARREQCAADELFEDGPLRGPGVHEPGELSQREELAIVGDWIPSPGVRQRVEKLLERHVRAERELGVEIELSHVGGPFRRCLGMDRNGRSLVGERSGGRHGDGIRFRSGSRYLGALGRHA
mmetsp:Transcript_2987/g.8939  ORF Transcript_2987/g.8939 Transcript_2987/m.8939 type:complete len:268 (-) Transcript_2987:73-876(-)